MGIFGADNGRTRLAYLDAAGHFQMVSGSAVVPDSYSVKDGTIRVVFDDTSVPPVTELNGTVFTVALSVHGSGPFVPVDPNGPPPAAATPSSPATPVVVDPGPAGPLVMLAHNSGAASVLTQAESPRLDNASNSGLGLGTSAAPLTLTSNAQFTAVLSLTPATLRVADQPANSVPPTSPNSGHSAVATANPLALAGFQQASADPQAGPVQVLGQLATALVQWFGSPENLHKIGSVLRTFRSRAMRVPARSAEPRLPAPLVTVDTSDQANIERTEDAVGPVCAPTDVLPAETGAPQATAVALPMLLAVGVILKHAAQVCRVRALALCGDVLLQVGRADKPLQ